MHFPHAKKNKIGILLFISCWLSKRTKVQYCASPKCFYPTPIYYCPKVYAKLYRTIIKARISVCTNKKKCDFNDSHHRSRQYAGHLLGVSLMSKDTTRKCLKLDNSFLNNLLTRVSILTYLWILTQYVTLCNLIQAAWNQTCNGVGSKTGKLASNW